MNIPFDWTKGIPLFKSFPSTKNFSMWMCINCKTFSQEIYEKKLKGQWKLFCVEGYQDLQYLSKNTDKSRIIMYF